MSGGLTWALVCIDIIHEVQETCLAQTHSGTPKHLLEPNFGDHFGDYQWRILVPKTISAEPFFTSPEPFRDKHWRVATVAFKTLVRWLTSPIAAMCPPYSLTKLW